MADLTAEKRARAAFHRCRCLPVKRYEAVIRDAIIAAENAAFERAAQAVDDAGGYFGDMRPSAFRGRLAASIRALKHPQADAVTK